MKKWLCLVIGAFFLLTVGCAALPEEAPGDTPTTTTSVTTTTAETTTTTTTETTTATTTTGIASDPTTTTTTTAPAFITEDAAVAIAEQYWNIRTGDRDPETGFMMTVGPMVLPTADTPEYIIALRWLVEDENGQVTHSSMLDRITINAYTGDVVDPATIQPE